MWNSNGANPFGFQNQNNGWNQGVPQPGAWGFHQQQPPMPPPMQQPFIGNQGMMPPVLGNNMFQNQPPPFLPNQQNFLQHQQVFPRFRQAPPPLPPQPNTVPNVFNMNVNRPPPPPPEVVPRPPVGNNGAANTHVDAANRNQLATRTGPNGSYQFDQRNDGNSLKSPPTQQDNDNQILSDQEKQFDVMFSAWEQGFDSWKRENQNNPDQNYVRQHILKMNEMRENMLKRRENLKRQQQQNSSNQQGKFDQNSINSEPSCKIPRLSNTTNFDHGSYGASRKASRWEKDESDYEKRNVKESQEESSSHGTTNKSRRQGDWDCNRCNKLQFAFRNTCKFCGIRKEDSEKMKNNGNQALKNEDGPNRPNSSLNSQNSFSDRSLFQTREDLKNSTGDNQNNPRPEENLFQRREPDNSQKRHSYSSGASFDSPNNSKTSSIDYNNSAKVVDYGHGNKQGGWAEKDSYKGKEWSPAPNRNNQRHNQRFDDRRFTERKQNVHPRIDQNRQNFVHEHEPVPQIKPAKPPEPQGEKVTIDDLIKPPGRNSRPPKLVIILRGLPGAGKTFIVKHIKSQESEMGGEAPRILSLDDYFECDGEYEYEKEMEQSYRNSLVKSFKKQIDDGYFSLILVDCINDKTDYYQPMWSYAKQKGFEVYIGSVDCDPTVCATRNVHSRTEKDIQDLHRGWEPTPSHFNKIDFSSFLQDEAIDHFEMADAENDTLNDAKDDLHKESDEGNKDQPGSESTSRNSQNEDDISQSSDAKDLGEEPFALPSSSKWEVADRQEKMAKLDGVSSQAIKRMADAHHSSINEWLEIDSADTKDTGKKRVRWADIEERRKQVKQRDIGFVVGQTNWKRLMDPNEGTQEALERTKIIPNRFEDRS